jgi:hypothetical protein
MSSFHDPTIWLHSISGIHQQIRKSMRAEDKLLSANIQKEQLPDKHHTEVPAKDRNHFPGFSSLPTVNGWDWLVGVFFVLIAGVYLLGRLQGNYPIVILSGDAGNIASYAAALDHPNWFKIDPGLNSADIIGIDQTINIPLIRALTHLTGNYGLASALLILPETFLQLLGFYILGRVLFKNRFIALLLALLTATTVMQEQIGMGEVWGIWSDSLPRVTFQSLLPFLLGLVLIWRDHPGRWPLLMVFSGLLVYVHPVSAPTWGFAIWLSLWLLLPKNWSWQRRLLVMLGLGTLFLAAITPYAINYLSHQGGSKSMDYYTTMSILEENAPLNILGAFGYFLQKSLLDLLLPLALVGFTATWLLKKTDRLPVRVVLIWMVGISITCVIVPFIEKTVTQHLHILPFETELVRGIRYLIPLLLIFWLWPLAELSHRPINLVARRAVISFGILLVVFWGFTNRAAVNIMRDTFSCFTQLHLVCSPPQNVDELIHATRKLTSPGDGVFFFDQNGHGSSDSLSIRYAALRPLVYTERPDINNRSSLPAWLKITQTLDVLRAIPDTVERIQGLIALAKSLDAKYLVINSRVLPKILADLPVTILMQDDDYSLLELR